MFDKLKISQKEFFKLLDKFLDDNAIWPDFVLYLENENYYIENPNKSLDELIEIIND